MPFIEYYIPFPDPQSQVICWLFFKSDFPSHNSEVSTLRRALTEAEKKIALNEGQVARLTDQVGTVLW